MAQERKSLKEKMFVVFPKQAKKGVCYVSFAKAPGTKIVNGYLHPCLGLPCRSLVSIGFVLEFCC
jgi:hypothetical protein